MCRLNQTMRQSVGYVYQPQVNNNIATQNKQRDTIASCLSRSSNEGELGGEGFTDIVRDIFQKGSKVLQAANLVDKAYTSELGTAIRNQIPSSDDKARPGFAGERHMLLKLPNGKTGVANWMGPGTEVIKRLKRGDPGRTPSDTVAKMHDVQYGLAQGAPTKAKQAEMVRAADNRMVRTLKGIAAGKHGGDSQRNIQAGMRLIQAKVLGEDLGLLDKQQFSGPLAKLPEGEKQLLMAGQAALQQAGYGILPGQELKSKLLKKAARAKTRRKAIKKASYSKTLPSTKAYRLYGSGNGLLGFINTVLLPKLMRDVGVDTKHLNMTKVRGAVKRVVNMKNELPKLVAKLTKTILPILTRGKLRSLGLNVQGGNGVANGIMESLDRANIKLGEKLAKGMFKALKWFLSRQQGNGLKLAGSGLNLPGNGFWGDFAKGFKMVFKPGSKVLATVATALGQPEIGVPLGIVSELL